MVADVVLVIVGFSRKLVSMSWRGPDLVRGAGESTLSLCGLCLGRLGGGGRIGGGMCSGRGRKAFRLWPGDLCAVDVRGSVGAMNSLECSSCAEIHDVEGPKLFRRWNMRLWG